MTNKYRRKDVNEIIVDLQTGTYEWINIMQNKKLIIFVWE